MLSGAGASVPRLGVSAKYARKVLESTRERTQLAEPTTADVCVSYAKVETADTRTSLVDLLWAKKERSVQKHDAYKTRVPKGHSVGIASVFVSHAWGRPFSDLVGAIEEYIEHEPRHAHAFFWIDTLSVNQHQLADANQVPMDSHAWATMFGGAIRDMGQVCVVATPWERPMPLRRCWCLWELFSACAGEGVSITLCLPSTERALYNQAIPNFASPIPSPKI